MILLLRLELVLAVRVVLVVSVGRLVEVGMMQVRMVVVMAAQLMMYGLLLLSEHVHLVVMLESRGCRVW